MSRQTENKGNLQSGLGALTNARGKTYCLLQHRTTSAGHPAGQNEEIIVDYVLLGRSPKATVRFNDDQSMVSREHAALIRKEGKWIIKHLSNTNQTIVNGRPISEQWFLQHGDEIELANGGPRLAFLVPENPAVGTLGLTHRLSLFRKQALRPYQAAITAIGIVLLLSVAALGYWNFKTKKDLQATQLGLLESQMQQKAQSDTIATIRKENRQMREELKKKMGEMRKTMEGLRQKAEAATKAAMAARQALQSNSPGKSPSMPGEMEAYLSSVYFVEINKLEAHFDDGTSESVDSIAWYGTGFLLKSGQFVTARHVIEPWYYFRDKGDEALVFLNFLVNNGAEIIVHLTARGPNGDKLYFTSKDFRLDRSKDRSIPYTLEGEKYTIKSAGNDFSTDYAYAHAKASGSLQTTPRNISTQLTHGTELTTLSYPETLGAGKNGVKPHMIRVTVSRDGLENKTIMATGSGIAPGSSGGAVLYKGTDGIFRVVGILSAINDTGIDCIVPIDATGL